MKFSEKLMNLRKSKGMSQENLAEKLNVTRQTVSKWELDQTTPDLNKLIELSKLFEISIDELTNNVESVNAENEYKESSVEKNNRKLALKILVIGLIISAVIFGIGGIRQKLAYKENDRAYNEAYALSQAKFESAQKRLDEIAEERSKLKEKINSLDIEISNMENEKNIIFREDRFFSDRYYTKDNEIKVKRTELSDLKQQSFDLETEENIIKTANYKVTYNIVEPIKYLLFYYIGAGTAGVTILISLIYFLVTRKK